MTTNNSQNIELQIIPLTTKLETIAEIKKIDPTIIFSIVSSLKTTLKKNKVNIKSVYNIITLSMELIEKFNNITGDEKKQYIIISLQEVAKGDDGVLGTSDDLMSPDILNNLKNIIEQNLIEDLIDIIIEASKGNFDINKITNSATTIKNSCFLCLPLAHKNIT